MNKKLEINIGKKPDIVFQFDQFLNVEQAVDKFLNKKSNLEKLIAPLLPPNIEETIQKLIPEVKDGYTPRKGIDYDDGKDGETPTDEKIIALIEPRIQKLKGVDGKTPKKGIDYFTKQELQEIKKALKESILAELPKRLSDEELNIKFQSIQNILNNMPIRGASYLRQLIDVKMGTLDDLQYGFTYNKSTAQFTLTQITGGGGGSVDSVNGQTGVVVLDQDDIGDGTTYKQYSATEKTKLAGIETGAEVNTIDTVSDTTEIDLAITARDLTATIRAGSIDETKLDASVNASLDLADTAVQPSGLSGYQVTSAKDQNNGYAGLDAGGKLNPSQLPSLALSEYLGNFTDTTAALANAGVQASQVGDWFTVDTNGGESWIVTTSLPTTLADITKIKTPTSGVSSVFSRTGAVTAQNGDYTASQVTNAFDKTTDDTDDITVGTTNKFATAAEKTKLGFISVTQAVDLDTMESDIATNNAKVTNATHSGDMTGATALTAQPAIITGKSAATVASGDLLLIADINDSNNLKQVTAQSIADLGGASGATTALDNLAGVAINTSLVSDTDNTDDLGTTLKKWANLFVTTIGATATRVTKGWFTDIESTNIPTVGGTPVLSSLTAPQFTTIELGHASDTTLSRVSAGVVAVEGTNLVKAGATTTSGLTMATAKILGRSTASTGAVEEISVGSGLTLSGGSLSASTPSGIGWALKEYSTASSASEITSGTLALATDKRYKIVMKATGTAAKSWFCKINGVVSGTSYWKINQGRKWDGATETTDQGGFNDSQLNLSGVQWNCLHIEMNLTLLKSSAGTARPVFDWTGTGFWQDATEFIGMVQGAGHQNTQTDVTSINFNTGSGTLDWEMWIYKQTTS